MNILITGGAGSLGTAILKEINSWPDKNEHVVRVFDNNEHALSKINYSFTRKTYGSITNLERLNYAMRDIDICIHCAAMKNIEITEYNPHEVIENNIVGTNNVAMSAIENNVDKVLYISTDKAVDPINLYGVSKLAGEHIILRHNETQFHTMLSAFRSGNFEESNGAVKEVWERQRKNKEPLTITSFDCKRYYIPIESVAHKITIILKYMKGGEIFTINESVMKSKTVRTLLKEIYGNDIPPYKEIGLRTGEKLIETLYSDRERSMMQPFEHANCNVIRVSK